jgi:hypothetical protein
MPAKAGIPLALPRGKPDSGTPAFAGVTGEGETTRSQAVMPAKAGIPAQPKSSATNALSYTAARDMIQV